MGKTEKRELVSRVTVLLLHLLKWRYQPQDRGKSRRLSIANSRDQIADLIADSPSLKSVLDDHGASLPLRATQRRDRYRPRREALPRPMPLVVRRGDGGGLLAAVTRLFECAGSRRQAPVASFTHFLTNEASAAPCSFLSAACA